MGDLRALLGCAIPGQHRQIAMLAAGMASIIYAVDSMDCLEELPMSFLKNIQEIRDRARQQIENGAVTKSRPWII